MVGIFSIDNNSFDKILSHLDMESRNCFLKVMKEAAPLKAAAILRQPQYWRSEIALNPDKQRQIQKAAYFPRQLQNSFAHQNRPFEAFRAHFPQSTAPGSTSSNGTCQLCCHSQTAPKSSIFTGKAVLQLPLPPKITSVFDEKV